MPQNIAKDSRGKPPSKLHKRKHKQQSKWEAGESLNKDMPCPFHDNQQEVGNSPARVQSLAPLPGRLEMRSPTVSDATETVKKRGKKSKRRKDCNSAGRRTQPRLGPYTGIATRMSAPVLARVAAIDLWLPPQTKEKAKA